MTKYTRQAIMKCLLDMLETRPLDKITVKDICAACEINRNTFYYHFSDVYNVVESIFKYEAEKEMEASCGEDSLYRAFLNKYHLVLEHKKIFCHLLNSKYRERIMEYLEQSTADFVRHYVQKAAEGLNLTKNDIDYIVLFYGSAIIGNITKWIISGLPEDLDGLIFRLSESYRVTINNMIQNCVDENKNALQEGTGV